MDRQHDVQEKNELEISAGRIGDFDHLTITKNDRGELCACQVTG
jgi:hypothetical protein